MKNGITINGVEYRAIRHLPSLVAPADGCYECDLFGKCQCTMSPCLLFAKTGYWVNFKKAKK